MAKTKDVKLVEGFEWHGAMVKSLTIKEPTGRHIAELGEPCILVRTANGMYFVEQTNTIKQYIERCLTHEGGSTIVNLLGMVDYLMLKDEIRSRHRSTSTASKSRRIRRSRDAGPHRQSLQRSRRPD